MEKLYRRSHVKYCASDDITLLLSLSFAKNTKMITIRDEKLKIISFYWTNLLMLLLFSIKTKKVPGEDLENMINFCC